MSEREFLKEIKKLSDGKFGQEIVIAGDAQVILMKIYALVTDRLTTLNGSDSQQVSTTKHGASKEIKI